MNNEPKKDLRTIVMFYQKDNGIVYAFLDSFSETRLSVTQPIILTNKTPSEWMCYCTSEKDVVCHFTIPGNIIYWHEGSETDRSYYFSILKKLKVYGNE
jgi:hypothetical protein